MLPIATSTSASGVSRRLPSIRVTSLPSSYSSVNGRRLRATFTSTLSSTDGSSSRWRKSCTAVKISSAPNTRNMNENVASSAAPSAMKIARRISAARIPNVSTRCWCCSGTANVLMMITNTNRLSTERLFSTT